MAPVGSTGPPLKISGGSLSDETHSGKTVAAAWRGSVEHDAERPSLVCFDDEYDGAIEVRVESSGVATSSWPRSECTDDQSRSFESSRRTSR